MMSVVWFDITTFSANLLLLLLVLPRLIALSLDISKNQALRALFT